MARPESSNSRTSVRYLAWVKAVKERDNYTCLICRTSERTVGAYHTDGVFVGDGRDSDFDLEIGGTFCRRCALNELRLNNLGGRKPGFSHSEDAKYKMSLAKIGVPKSEEHRKKISEALLARRKNTNALH